MRKVPSTFRLALLISPFALAACTTGAYKPGIESFVASSEVAAPIVSQELASFREGYRVSVINRGRPVVDQATPEKRNLEFATVSVCAAIAASSIPSLSGGELTKFGEAATAVATVPDPTFWTALAGLFRDYKIAPPRALKDFDPTVKQVIGRCIEDFTFTKDPAKVDQLLINYATGGPEGFVAAFGAFQELLALIEPVVTQALATVDEQRRAAALRDFFSDKSNTTSLKGHVAELVKLSETMDKYRRYRAMQAVRNAIEELPLSWKPYQLKADSPKAAALVSAAEGYDTAFQAQISPSFDQMNKALEKLQDVASGSDTLALLESASQSATSLAKAVAAVEKLTSDPESKKRLRSIWRRLLGRKPEKEDAAE